MKHCVYVGGLNHLLGKTAMVREADDGGRVLAQFDDVRLTRSGKGGLPLFHGVPLEGSAEEPPEDAIGFNWHLFDKADFAERRSEE